MSARRNPFAAPRGHKYSAKRTTVDGITFDSKREGRRYQELRLLERAHLIDALELQPTFPIVIHGEPVRIRSEGFPNGREVVYRADFRYREGGRIIVEDVKGMDTSTSRLKRALVETIYGIRVRTL